MITCTICRGIISLSFSVSLLALYSKRLVCTIVDNSSTNIPLIRMSICKTFIMNYYWRHLDKVLWIFLFISSFWFVEKITKPPRILENRNPRKMYGCRYLLTIRQHFAAVCIFWWWETRLGSQLVMCRFKDLNHHVFNYSTYQIHSWTKSLPILSHCQIKTYFLFLKLTLFWQLLQKYPVQLAYAMLSIIVLEIYQISSHYYSLDDFEFA